jgi:hypothetical protein
VVAEAALAADTIAAVASVATEEASMVVADADSLYSILSMAAARQPFVFEPFVYTRNIFLKSVAILARPLIKPLLSGSILSCIHLF